MKAKCSAIKLNMFGVFSVISLFTAKQKILDEHSFTVLII